MSQNMLMKQADVESQDVFNGSKSELEKTKLSSVWDLATSENCDDVNRFKYFLELIIRLTVNISDKLGDLAKRDVIKYGGRRCLFEFSLDAETKANKDWILFSWPIIYREFRTSEFSRTKQSARLVGNVLRHMVKWMNSHYQLEQPILYENRDVYIETNHETGKKHYKNTSFISF